VELLERKSTDSGLEIRQYGRTDPSRWPRGTIYPQKSALTSPTSGSRSVGIVRSRTQAMEFFPRNSVPNPGSYPTGMGGGGGSGLDVKLTSYLPLVRK
jgi:hypothetical protein